MGPRNITFCVRGAVVVAKEGRFLKLGGSGSWPTGGKAFVDVSVGCREDAHVLHSRILVANLIMLNAVPFEPNIGCGPD